MSKLQELKNAFRFVPAMFRTVWSTDRRYLIYIVCETLCFALLPYPALYLEKYALDALGSGKDYREFVFMCGGLLLLGCAISMLKSVFNSIRPNRTTVLNSKLTNRFHLKCMELDYQLLAEKEVQELQVLASEYISWRMSNTIWNFIWLFSGMVSFVISFIVLVRISLFLLALTIAKMALDIWIAARFMPLRQKCQEDLILKNRWVSYYEQVASEYSNAKEVRIFSIGKRFANRITKIVEEIYGQFKKQRRLSDISGVVNILLSNGFEYLIYAIMGIGVLKGKMTIGTFLLVISNIAILEQYLERISSTLVGYSETAKYAEYYEKFMALESEFVKDGQIMPETAWSGDLQIEFRNVSFRYPGKADYALKNFNVKINKGERILVVGENGAGKSTFVKLLMRLYDPEDGEILMNGVNIKEFRYEEYLKLFAPVFQDFKLFAFSVHENIAPSENLGEYGGGTVQEPGIGRVAAAAQKAGISERIEKLPLRYGAYFTKLFEESGIDFSGGEQQKIAIARAYYKENAVVTVLDEPTSALDPRAEYLLYERFSDLIGENTAFFISHRLSSARFCDKVLVIKEGENREFGSHDELMERNGIYKDMFSRQASYYV